MHFKLITLFECTLVTALLLYPYRTFGWACIVGEFALLNLTTLGGLFLYATYASVLGNCEDGRLVLPEPRWFVVARRFWWYGVVLVVLGWVCALIAVFITL